MVSESIYVEKGVGRRGGGGQRPPEANEIWKYQIKWSHFHHMGTEYIFFTIFEAILFLVPILSHFISYFLVYLLFTNIFFVYQEPKYYFR